MSSLKNDKRFPAALVAVLLLVPAAWFSQASADDPQPICPKCSSVERGIPILSKVPFVSRLFKKVAAEPIQDGDPQMFERIGVDFDLDVCQDCQGTPGICRSTARPQLFIFSRTADGKLAAARCENDRRCEHDYEEVCGEDCEEASACCRAAGETAKHAGLSWERIVELTAKNAAIEASLEAQTAFHEEKTDLTDSFVEILIENARLQAQVETQAKQAELTKELLTLVSENARLKAQVEMAEIKLTLAQEATRLAVENEQLKHALQVATSRKAQPYTPDSEAEVQTSNRVPVAKPAR